MKNYEEFKQAVQGEALRGELTAYLAEKKPEDQEAKILAVVEFAKAKGFDVTVEDLSLESVEQKELDDAEIEQASGGEWCWNDYSCFAVSYYDLCDAIMENCGRVESKMIRWQKECGAAYVAEYKRK